MAEEEEQTMVDAGFVRAAAVCTVSLTGVDGGAKCFDALATLSDVRRAFAQALTDSHKLLWHDCVLPDATHLERIVQLERDGTADETVSELTLTASTADPQAAVQMRVRDLGSVQSEPGLEPEPQPQPQPEPVAAAAALPPEYRIELAGDRRVFLIVDRDATVQRFYEDMADHFQVPLSELRLNMPDGSELACTDKATLEKRGILPRTILTVICPETCSVQVVNPETVTLETVKQIACLFYGLPHLCVDVGPCLDLSGTTADEGNEYGEEDCVSDFVECEDAKCTAITLTLCDECSIATCELVVNERLVDSATVYYLPTMPFRRVRSLAKQAFARSMSPTDSEYLAAITSPDCWIKLEIEEADVDEDDFGESMEDLGAGDTNLKFLVSSDTWMHGN